MSDKSHFGLRELHRLSYWKYFVDFPIDLIFRREKNENAVENDQKAPDREKNEQTGVEYLEDQYFYFLFEPVTTCCQSFYKPHWQFEDGLKHIWNALERRLYLLSGLKWTHMQLISCEDGVEEKGHVEQLEQLFAEIF